MTEREAIPAHVRALKTSALVASVAAMETRIMLHRALPFIYTAPEPEATAARDHCAAELDARIPPRETP